MSFTFINPESLGAPRGYANGVLAEAGGRLLFISGQIAWDEHQQIVSEDIVAQFDRALANVITVVTEAGGSADQIARLILYVVDKNEYRDRMKEIGERYRARMGKQFPAMVLVEIKSLLEDRAKIEIEGIAVLKA
jgi:enamine deaminase RidA (YjgF/YER057c/UK114 family)